MYKKITDNIYSIFVGLPKSPLKFLNAYVIVGEERNLLVDTGERKQTCYDDLMTGLSELGITMNNTDIFLTHMHSDHISLVPDIVQPETTVYMSRPDYEYQMRVCQPTINDTTRSTLTKFGMPAQHIKHSSVLLHDDYFINPFVNYTPVDDGHVLHYGGYALECILTPGHTTGHMCLYEREQKLLIGGDHVLFSITPNISRFTNVRDSLGNYIKSLLKVSDLQVETYLPAHRGVDYDFNDRLFEIIEHHGRRIQEAMTALEAHPGATPYELAQYMTWNIRYKGDWSNFPAPQLPFAVHEVAAHLDHLVEGGRARVELIDGTEHFWPII